MSFFPKKEFYLTSDQLTTTETVEKVDKEQTPAPVKSRWRRLIGYSLLAISTVTWSAGFVVAPFVPIPAAKRVALAGALIVVGEITFWAAMPFLGREIVFMFRKQLNPLRWFKKKSP